MVPDIFGWCGKILNIDLYDATISELETLSYSDRFLGDGASPRGSTGKMSRRRYVHSIRIFNLQRAVLLREGWRLKLDDVPAAFNFEDPVDTVFMNLDVIVPASGNDVISRKGQTLDRDDFDTGERNSMSCAIGMPSQVCNRLEPLNSSGYPTWNQFFR